jgi:hypothetical protein
MKGMYVFFLKHSKMLAPSLLNWMHGKSQKCTFNHYQEFPMTVLAKEMITNAEVGRMLSDREVSRFKPAEIREAIQSLVSEGKDALAIALGDAGLSLYPESEDILAITGLLSLMRQEWAQAVDLIESLRVIQGENTPPFTYVMLVRALRCNLEPVRALAVVNEGLKKYPDQIELTAESLILQDFSNSAVVNETTAH